jgi:carbon-monoxide dehydrogenase medium subunit
VKLPPFSVHRPGSVSEASLLLTDLGEDAAAYCGGTELLLAMKLGLASYDHLIDLKRVPGMHGIEAANGEVRIGATTTHNELETSPLLRARYPELPVMISRVANLRVRSVGTLGGNLCFADPHSDPAPFLMAVGATMLCQQTETTRRIPAAEFLTGPYETAMRPGELLLAVELPARAESTGLAHLRMKLTERPVVTVTASVTTVRGAVSAVRLIIGSVASTPFSADAAASALIGASRDDVEARAEACAAQAAADCTPLPGGECSVDYLRHLVSVYSRDALREAFATASSAQRTLGQI